ncbi:MAG: inositol monophosphatase, partial [Acidobacteriota bacterium]
MQEELLETAISGARAGAEVLRHYFRDAGLEIRSKGGSGHDLVSRADHESEDRVIATVLERFP